MEEQGKIGVVIAAAGSSSRMGGRDKLTEPMGGIPVILRTLAAVEAVPEVDEIVVVTRKDRVEEYRQLLGQCSRLLAVVPGGSTRQESVQSGVRALSSDCRLAAIHDGARPLVTPEVFARCIEAARSCGAATAAVPVKDTIKLADERGRVVDTPDRSRLWAVQTPRSLTGTSTSGRQRRRSAGGFSAPTTASCSRPWAGKCSWCWGITAI